MPTCVKISIKHRKVCTGDLRHFILLQARDLQASNSSVDFIENFTDNGNVWAAIQTARAGVTVFDASNIEIAVTHIFYIRYIAGFTQQVWIEFEGQKYDIFTVEDLDERHEFQALMCSVRGDSTKPVNFA